MARSTTAAAGQVSAVTPGNAAGILQSSHNDLILSLLQNLTVQIAEIRAERGDHGRSRNSPCNQSRSSSLRTVTVHIAHALIRHIRVHIHALTHNTLTGTMVCVGITPNLGKMHVSVFWAA